MYLSLIRLGIIWLAWTVNTGATYFEGRYWAYLFHNGSHFKGYQNASDSSVVDKEASG